MTAAPTHPPRPPTPRTVNGILVPANAISRVHVPPMYDRSPVVVSCMSWKGGLPSTLTACSSTMCFPPRILRKVVFPAPLQPSSRQRDPRGRLNDMSLIMGGLLVTGRPSAAR